ncbi:hypothetical protein NDU88_004705 [Pleurodeles waltl]|uniref:Uncharacterized protein n=1 Tax=Pleurodeles waltl TaxID=8319 RepID=A0AAV7W9P5_PLEWA|nr:hypothetical protein NDU88_004705 [Pleurodeles waltl]
MAAMRERSHRELRRARPGLASGAGTPLLVREDGQDRRRQDSKMAAMRERSHRELRGARPGLASGAGTPLLVLKVMGDGKKHFCQMPEEAWDWVESYKGGKLVCARDAHGAAGRQWKRYYSKDRPPTDRLRRPTQLQVTQEQRAAIQTAASLMELLTSESDRIYSSDICETEDTSDLESVVSVNDELPQVTPQTADDII